MSEQHFSQERRDAFGRNASAYRDGRPGYPEEVYRVLQRVCGLGPESQVLEIGPGAGQANGWPRTLLRRPQTRSLAGALPGAEVR